MGMHNIDAEYMNRWLGESTQIESLSPKTIFDVQTLIEYYRDIIVPTQKVSIAFPTADSESPRACVSEGEVMIPFHMLKQGRVDETIGAMIHELHHIKLTPSEKFIHLLNFKAVRTLMEKIDCYGTPLSERVFVDSSITMERIMSDEKQPADIEFLRKVMSDLLFLLNAVEDVRIDANTPPNLRKYIDKVDKVGGEQLKKHFEEGNISEDDRDLSSIGFMLLCHHKGIINFPLIEEKFGDTQAIVNAEGTQLPIDLFNAFQDEIAQHIFDEYIKHCGIPKDAQGGMQGGDGDEFDISSYFGEKVNHSIGDSLEQQFTDAKAPKHDEGKLDAESSKLDDAEKQLKMMNPAPPQPQNGAGDTKITASTHEVDENTEVPEHTPVTAESIRQQQEEEWKDVFMSPEMVQQVKSFKNVRVHTATEHFSDQAVTYDTVIFDATN